MNKRKITQTSILIIFICIVIGSILITIANYLPVRDSVRETALTQLESKGVFPEVTSLQGEFGDFHSEKPTVLELATDALMLKMALYEGEGKGIEQAFRCYSEQFEEEYSRYWHGYVVILRALFLVFDYYEIRIINGVCQSILFILTAYYIWKRKGVRYLLAFATSYFLLMPLALTYCLQYTWIYYVTFLAVFCYVKYFDFWEKDGRYIYLFLLTGILAIYLDLWTYPLLTWGVPAVWMILLQKEQSAFVHIKKVVCSAIAWGIGYAGMWIGKWAVGSIVLRENLFRRALKEIFLWTIEEGDTATTLPDRFKAIYLNIETYAYKLYLLVLILWFAYWIFKAVKIGIITNRKAPALCLIGISSVAWYFILADHVTMHHVFTHRIFVVSIAAFLGIVLISTERKKTEEMDNKAKIKYLSVIALTGLLAIVLMFQIRDTYSRHNGDLGFSALPINGSVSMGFIPEYSEVTHIQVGLYTENSTTGFYHLSVLDDDTVVEETVLPVDGTQGNNFHSLEVNWKLKVGHPYTLIIETVDTDGDILIYATENELLGIPEYGIVTIGNENVNGQMLAGITYYCRLVESKKQILFIIIYWAFGLMLIYSFWSCRWKDGAFLCRNQTSDKVH